MSLTTTSSTAHGRLWEGSGLVDIFRRRIRCPHQGPTPQRRAPRRFDEEFKAPAVRLVLDEGTSIGGVVRDLYLTETSGISTLS